MSTSLMFHCFGLTKQEYMKTEYNTKKVIFEVKIKKDKLHCANCSCKRNLIKRSTSEHDFLTLPMSRGKKIIVRTILQYLKCRNCGKVLQEKSCFANGKKNYTKGFALYVNDLCRIITIKDVGGLTGASWTQLNALNVLARHYGKLPKGFCQYSHR